MGNEGALMFETFLNKKKILLRAPVLTQSGYGVHSRQIARWLLSKENLDVYFQAMSWGNTPWIINSDFCNGLIGKMMEKTVDPTGQKYDATIQVQLPNEWDSTLSSVNIGVSAFVETDICNPSWLRDCEKMTAVVVPSNHCVDVIKKTGSLTSPVHVIPESYPDEIREKKKTRVDDMVFDTNFNFLFVGQITGKNAENDRKNIFYTIKWFCEVFDKDKDVGLVIKTNSGRNTKIDNQIVTNMLRSVLSELKKKSEPKIYLIHGEMSDQEMASLYTHPQIKALVSLTRGEGYGLPLLEAAASSLPVIATGWSGHLDFLSKGKFLNIDYKLENVHPSRVDNMIFMQNSKWANVSEEDFKKKILKFRNSHSTPKEWAKELSEKILDQYSFESISKLYDQKIGNLL